MEDSLYKSYLKCIIKEDEDDGEETLDPTPDQFMIDDAEGVGYYNIHFCMPESFIYSTLQRIDEYHDAMNVAKKFFSEFCSRWNVKAYDNVDEEIYCEAIIPKQDLKEFVTYVNEQFFYICLLQSWTDGKYDEFSAEKLTDDQILEILENFQKGGAWSINEVESAAAYANSYDEQPLAFAVSEMIDDFYN